MPVHKPVRTCHQCSKETYVSRQAAKNAGNLRYPTTHTWPVWCEPARGWHYTSVKPMDPEEGT